MAKMYELTDAYVSLLAQYEDAATDKEREEILGMLSSVENDIAAKAENYARLMKNAEADSIALKAEIDRLTDKKRKADNLVKRVKEYLHYAMEIAGATELQTAIGKWRIQKNPPSVAVTNAEAIPAEYWKQPEPVLDRMLVLNDLKAGCIVDGCELQQTEGLRFR